MKKLLCCILLFAMLLPMGSALADQSLYDMWIDYTYDYPDFSGKRKARSHDFGRYVEDCWVDTTSDYLLREAMHLSSGGTAEDLIVAWTRLAENEVGIPVLSKLALNINSVDAELVRSESYSYYSGGTETGMLELYMLDIAYRNGIRTGNYSMIVSVEDNYGDITIEYVVTRGDLSALGSYLSDKATTNYLGTMFVYFCDEWVSLREEPSTKSTRLAKVPKFDTVTDCYAVGETGFVFCTYQGKKGFILWDYLEHDEYLDYYLD